LRGIDVQYVHGPEELEYTDLINKSNEKSSKYNKKGANTRGREGGRGKSIIGVRSSVDCSPVSSVFPHVMIASSKDSLRTVKMSKVRSRLP